MIFNSFSKGTRKAPLIEYGMIAVAAGDGLNGVFKDIDVDLVIIPSVMLKPYSETFLDGKTLSYVKEQTGKKFFVIKEVYSTKELTDYLWTLE